MDAANLTFARWRLPKARRSAVVMGDTASAKDMQKPQFSKGNLVRPRGKNVILVVEEVFPNNKGPGYLVLCRPKVPRQPGDPYDDSHGLVHETTLFAVQKSTELSEETGRLADGGAMDEDDVSKKP